MKFTTPSHSKNKNQNLSNKTVIGIRTHKWTEAEDTLHTQLQQYFDSKDIFVVIDETKNFVQTPDNIQRVSLNKNYLNQNNLLDNHPNPNGLGWLCGDYFYYALADHIDADYYWLIEPDVAFTFDNLSDFFSKFQMEAQDALLYNFAKALPSWAWTERAKTIHHDVYQAFFPLTRLSFKAIAACKQERQTVTAYFKDNNIALNQFPNDESLVATAVVKHGLEIENLNYFWPTSFKYFTYRNPILGDSAKNLLPSNQVIHPFRRLEYLGELLAAQVQPVAPNKNFFDLISRSVIDLTDIETIMTKIEQKVLSGIHLQIKNHCINQKYFLSIQKSFDEIASFANYEDIKYKSWIWKNNTLVLDATLLSTKQIYTLEYIFDNNTLSCNIFSRSKDNRIFEFFRKNYHNFNIIDNKINLFHQADILAITEDSIKSVITTFINTLKNINIQHQESIHE